MKINKSASSRTYKLKYLGNNESSMALRPSFEHWISAMGCSNPLFSWSLMIGSVRPSRLSQRQRNTSGRYTLLEDLHNLKAEDHTVATAFVSHSFSLSTLTQGMFKKRFDSWLRTLIWENPHSLTSPNFIWTTEVGIGQFPEWLQFWTQSNRHFSLLHSGTPPFLYNRGDGNY